MSRRAVLSSALLLGGLWALLVWRPSLPDSGSALSPRDESRAERSSEGGDRHAWEGHRRSRSSVASTTETSVVRGGWKACVRAGVEEGVLRDCLAPAFGGTPPSGSELGVWVCGASATRDLQRVVVEEALALLRGRSALLFMDEFERGCDDPGFDGFLRACTLAVGRRDPAWSRALGDALTPDLLFDESRGTAIVRVAKVLAEAQGDERIGALLEQGGRGVLGGSPEQVDRSATIAIVLSGDGREALDYIASILASGAAPAEAGIGNTLIHFLGTSTGKCWPAGDSAPALELVTRVLDDQRFAREAATQLLGEFGGEVPGEWDPDTWRVLRDRARSILGAD